ncbi:hypothetical protein [Sodalis sp. dw_96]|uniref:hypothetical protein n=1 Tax=Sodalis sp. dw_96 TaxID=2719794 RepID=UPI001BD3E17E|nr:hypothetical protein [Sodalis sp. dw_96]
MNASNGGSRPAERRCGRCRFCQRDRDGTEQAIPGLAMLGSAFGASISDSRVCSQHDRLVSPNDSCSAFNGED